MDITILRATVAGIKTPAGQIPGYYFPPTGISAARFSTNIAVDNPDWRDADGVYHKSNPDFFYITVFNNQYHDWADDFARNVTVGKGLNDIVLRRKTYPKQQRGPAGELLVKADGTPFMVTSESYTLHGFGNQSFGKDSSKTVNAEVDNWKGFIDFNSRPPFWQKLPEWMIKRNYIPLADYEHGQKAWATICAARKATKYVPGMKIFGYAIVRETGGAGVPAQPAANPGQMPQMPPGFGYGTANNGAAPANAPVNEPATQLQKPLPPLEAGAVASEDIPY